MVPRTIAANLFMGYGPLRQTWLCAKGHCMEVGRTVKICYNLFTMGESAGHVFKPWAVAQALVQNQLLQNNGFFSFHFLWTQSPLMYFSAFLLSWWQPTQELSVRRKLGTCWIRTWDCRTTVWCTTNELLLLP